MVRFSCFNSHISSNKPKKTAQSSLEPVHKTMHDCYPVQMPNDLSNPIRDKSLGNTQICDVAKHFSNSSAVERFWKSEEMKSNFDTGDGLLVDQAKCLKKSQSLGSELFLKGRVSAENEIDNEIDQRPSCDDCQDYSRVMVPGNDKEENEPSQHDKAAPSDTVPLGSDIVNDDSIFSIGEPHYPKKEGRDCDTFFVEHADDRKPRIPSMIIKSQSLPKMSTSEHPCGGGTAVKFLAFRAKSCEDLCSLELKWKDTSADEVHSQVRQGEEQDHTMGKPDKDNFENCIDDGFDSYNYSGLARDWIVPVLDEGNTIRKSQDGFSVHPEYEFPGKDFKIKRIEEWVDSLQHCSPLEERNDFLHSDDLTKEDADALNGLNAAKADHKITPGMQAAKRYISSLSAAASTAQLVNHGLVAIPLLGAFVSLRVLNLSGNAIVRITAGALPRGLHMLNLSKNNICAIEGLRELTRLRVLDLSYNRICRIGHGLASCSSLKELYLAGNKISEVEGLHRLLKLSVLDLRFNKISTAKCLGQLAANYNSLQAISLEGNPAQKNVGDEQLKKYLQSLLPHLAYFNRQPIKVGILKDAADRSVRLGISSHQFDRGLRSDHKALRKSVHGAGAHRTSSSSIYSRKNPTNVPPSTRSKGKHAPLPPIGNKAVTHHQHHIDFTTKLLNLKTEFGMRRSRSEGTLGVF